MLNVTVNEINDLTEEQRGVFREGLRADLGQQGFDEFFDEMFRREQEASGRAIHIAHIECLSCSSCSNGGVIREFY